MDLYRLTIQDSQDTMQFDLLDAPINIEDVEGAVDNTVLSGDVFTDFLYLKKRWEQKWAIMCKDEYERLRGFYTRQWSLATVPSVKVTQGYLKGTEWEGQIIYINAPYGGEINGLTKMTGDTSQASYTGKNLIYLSPNTTASALHGIVATYDEATGMCHVSGTSDNGDPNGGGWSNIGLETACSLPQGTYTFSATSTRDYRIILRIFSNASTYVTVQLDRNVTSAQITTTFTAVKYRIHLESLRNSPIDDTWGIMLESGSQATAFQRYLGGYPSPNPEFPQPIHTVTGEQTITINGQAFTIDLGTTELNDLSNGYQDEIAFDGSEWKVRKVTHKLTLDGSNDEGWTSTGTNVFASLANMDIDVANSPTGLCSHAKFNPVQTSVTSSLANGEFAVQRNNPSMGRFFFKNTAISTVNDFKTWLATNLPEIVYNAYTPTETTITDQALIAQLEAVRAALLEGENLVEVTANGSNLPAKSITLQGIEGRENPILPQTNVRISLSDDGVLNACECRQNVTLSMRETA